MFYRFISLILILSSLLACAASLTSCLSDIPDVGGKPPSDGGGTADKSIITPDFREYGRGTVAFDEMTYTRPDAERIISDFSAVTDVIEANEIPYEDQLGAVYSLEDGYILFTTMYNYSTIRMYEDVSDTYWCGEYEYISGYAPTFSSTLEKLFVAAARSVYAQSFETDYFGAGLIEEYADGGIFTDALVALLEEETEIENRYSALSTANVVITYKNMTDSLDGIMKFYAESYGKGSLTYSIALEDCTRLYEAKVSELSVQMLIDLLKVRKKISNELGYDSYATYAYETLYHDYTPEQMLAFIGDVAEFVVPVYYTVSYYVLWPYFDRTEEEMSLDRVDLINTLYYAYEDMDEGLHDVYSYMLQYGLYDIESKSENRFDGSFTTYLDAYNAPYAFVSTYGDCGDYMDLAHEFGHFYDSFVNYNSTTSLDLLEVSSQALEYLTLIEIKDELGEQEYKHLLYSQISSSFDVLLYQSFYALFEHYAYEIAYDAINESTLIAAMKRAATDMGMSADYFDSLDHIMMPHIMLYPFYVQSYSVSAAVALEIYYTECGTDGAGLAAYIDLIRREDPTLTLEENLGLAGLASPFEEDHLKQLSDMIHYQIMGSHYYKESTDKGNET